MSAAATEEDRAAVNAFLQQERAFLREAIESADLNRLRRYCYSLSARPRQHAAA